MTKDEIIQMAREVEAEAGFQWCVNFIELERFAALVAEKERDALKQIAWTDLMRQGGLVTWNDAYELGQRVMAVLESRGNK